MKPRTKPARMKPAQLDALNKLIYEKQTDAFLAATSDPSLVLAGVDTRDCSVLHAAAIIEDSSPIFERACARGLDVNLSDANGNTALMTAVNYRCPNNARSLIALGADIHHFNEERRSALHVAAANEDLVCTALLLDAGAHIDADGGNLRSPLCTVAERSLAIVELLLARGADINYGDGNGTPIMVAISYEDAARVRFFLERGADIRAPKNRSGETTLEFAERVRNAEIVAMLRERLGA